MDNTWPIVIISLLAVLDLFFVIFLLLIRPMTKRRERMKRYSSVRFAHRGLHSDGVPENSLGAFARACERGFGIELDIRLSRDGELVVFHDDTLDRMTNECGPVKQKTLAELREISLLGTDEKIPSFLEVLELVDGRVPLLVELKENAGENGVSRAAADMLANYKGEYIVESFNPLTLAEFGKYSPEVLRGILAENFLYDKKRRKPMYFLLQNMVLNCHCKPDFIAFNHKHHKNAALSLIRTFFKAPSFAWTVTSREDEALAYKHGFSGVIFEKYDPES